MTTEYMLNEARSLIRSSYAPYSSFRVAAVLEDTEGQLFAGVNVENSSYGMTMCAERSAVFSAVASGSRAFRSMVIYSPDGPPIPCGACRQVLWEFCDEEFSITVASDGIPSREYRLGDLLPEAFQL
ncbi:cytidine deaminase [Candidatus Fermentibacteria bacterium]|nr:MAG: cytidine deaminase [Candidatus Fermentibacteria bacterium]